MKSLQYDEFVKKVVVANAPLEVDLLRMRSLWASVISMAYNHECECEREKKLAEVGLPYLKLSSGGNLIQSGVVKKPEGHRISYIDERD